MMCVPNKSQKVFYSGSTINIVVLCSVESYALPNEYADGMREINNGRTSLYCLIWDLKQLQNKKKKLNTKTEFAKHI